MRAPFIFLFFLFLGSACDQENTSPVKVPVLFPEVSQLPDKLSEFALFETENLQALIPNDGVIPYDLNTALFSDYAEKQRFIFIPEGKTLTYLSETSFAYPEGSMLIKNFYYPQAEGKVRIVETRLLLNYPQQWKAVTYIWNEEQNEAFRKRSGDVLNVSWQDDNGNGQRTRYIVPNENDCKNCHEENEQLVPLGPKARNLNKSYPYASGIENQLRYWQKSGMLAGLPNPETISSLPVWHDAQSGTRDERARAYLEVNCANCHNPKGSAENSGLYLEYEQTSLMRLGVCKSPVASGKGSCGLSYDIAPGQPEASILLCRMQSNEPEIQMPELGRTSMHEEAVALISAWIAAMPYNACPE